MGKLRIFIITVLLVWIIGTIAYIYLIPNIIYNSIFNSLIHTSDAAPGGIPFDTLYTAPTLGSPSSSAFFLSTGANHDTLYTVGVLNLSAWPEILYVPNISDRYYSIELVNSRGEDFADIGNGTSYNAGNYLISGPGWQGKVPANMTMIFSPDDEVLLIARVLVYNNSDLPVVYNLSKQIQLTSLNN
jgi:hypothetical protein